MSKFKIYKASAGSGKTFSLVLEYILILINNPNEYKHILAVTFTNDATEEMKQRVLKQLHILSQHPDKSNYLQDIVKQTGFDAFHIQMRASESLQNILHDYSNFNICTIDAFFQKILRAFAKDIGLSAGYNLHLETETAIHEVTEKVIANTNPEHKQSKWLMQAAIEKIEDGKSWNFRNELRELFKETFREKFQEKEKSIQESYKSEEQIEELMAYTKSEMKTFEDELNRQITNCNAILKKYELTRSSFSGKDRSFYGWVINLQNGEYKDPGISFTNALNNVEKWYTKSGDSSLRDSIIESYNNGLNDALVGLYQYYQSHIANYNSNLLIKQNLTQFVIFESMVEELSNYKSEHDILFITDTNQFINELIKDNDESFIFEKAGTYYHHYLIDEFQDTSALQWENFRPLVSNAASQGYTSMVVGDVKQSIYRFRNGDWRLLHEKAADDITYHEVIPLKYNFRSYENIIKFNNTIYSIIPNVVSNIYRTDNKIDSDWDKKFNECYNDQEQEVPSDKLGSGGFIKLKLFTKEEEVEEEAEESMNGSDAKLNDMVIDIQSALGRGYKPSDMAVLVFTRAQAQMASQRLQHYVEENKLQSKINIVTQSSLSIGNSHSVRLITAALSYLVNKKDVIQLANVYLEFTLHFHPEQQIDVSSMQNSGVLAEIIQKSAILKSMPVSLLVNELLTLFDIGDIPDEYIFIQYFKDAVYDYLKKYPDDLSTFMDWWNDSQEKYQVAIPENENSLRILTIHKSKGLQFHLVFIPFADWSLDSTGLKTDILWLDMVNETTSTSQTIPVRYDKRMLQSKYTNEYLENKFYNYLDKLNLLYVATTRAVAELYIYANRPGEYNINQPKPNIKFILSTLLFNPPDIDNEHYISLAKGIQPNKYEIILGEKTAPHHDEKKSKFEFINTCGSGINIMDSLSIKQQALDLRDDAKINYEEKRESGILFHQILSETKSKEQAINLIHKMHLQKLISSKQHSQFKKDVEIMYGQSLMQKLSNGFMTYSEYTISINNRILKPDTFYINDQETVVIDYKTGKPMPEYINQVKEYCDAVKTIFGKPTTGYIYYTLTQQFVQAV